jgi:uncharacterized protein (TIGR02271 family)
MAWEPATRENGGPIVLPLHAEEISVAKRRVITGSVEISTVTREREQLVDELLAHESVEIERKPVGKTVARMPAVRKVGNTIIIPVMEEVLVVERRLIVKEEVRVRLVQKKESRPQRMTVRKQELVVNRRPR